MGAIIAISSIIGGDIFVRDLFWETFYHQHRGPEYSGLAMLEEKGIILTKTHKGWFRPAFQNDLGGFFGPLGIGHISSGSPEPIFMHSTFPDFALCFVGNIINQDELWRCFLEKGGTINNNMTDANLISRLIALSIYNTQEGEEDNFMRGINHMAQQVQGAFAIAILTESRVYVARGLDGHQTVVLGEKEGTVIAASESCGFYNRGFTIYREVEAGEIVILENGKSRQFGFIDNPKQIISAPCIFKWVYSANAASVILGQSVKKVRQHLGAMLARRDILARFCPDVIVPIKDSGGYAAIGYLNEFIRQFRESKTDKIPIFDEAIMRWIYAGRSYTPADERTRWEEAGIKQIPIPDPEYKDLIVVIVDDSIVTGNQFEKDLIPKVCACGFGEVHARISFPMLVSTCSWGKANKKKKKLAAITEDGNIRTETEMAVLLGLQSCYFNTVQDVFDAVGDVGCSPCVDCALSSAN